MSNPAEMVEAFIVLYWTFVDCITNTLPELTHDGAPSNPRAMAELSPRNAAAVSLAVQTLEELDALGAFD